MGVGTGVFTALFIECIHNKLLAGQNVLFLRRIRFWFARHARYMLAWLHAYHAKPVGYMSLSHEKCSLR